MSSEAMVIIENNENSSINTIIKYKKPKRKVQFVSDAFNTYIRDFLSSNPDMLLEWDKLEQQNKLNQFINENKIKMSNPNAEEEKLKRKMEKKNKIVEREKNKQIARVQNSQERPKSPYYFFKKEEEIVIKNENPSFAKKDIHVELQKRWKVVKESNSERLANYKILADKDAEIKKNIPPKMSNSLIKKKQRNEKNKEKYKPKKLQKLSSPEKQVEKVLNDEKSRFVDHRVKIN